MKDRRRAFRLDCSLEVRCHRVEPAGTLGRSFDGSLVDVSSTGARISTREHLTLDNRLFLEFALGELELAVDARVLRRDMNEEGRVYGLVFVDLDPAEQATISRYIFSEVHRRAAGPAAA